MIYPQIATGDQLPPRLDRGGLDAAALESHPEAQDDEAVRWRRAVSVVGIGMVVLLALGAGPRSTPKAAPSSQTHPSVHPHRGDRKTHFIVHLTAREDLGAHGLVFTDYRVNARGRRGARCRPAATVLLASGGKGSRLGATLEPGGAASWCAGAYQGTVLLERGPYCPPAPRPHPCPQFASRTQKAGGFRFVVR